tara:strand:+ start:231 stop:464 length:234 start_codon:yes stop_codon:yes gene_type:complete
MKESKLIQLKNRVESLTNVVKMLLQEVRANTTLSKGTLTAFQLHIGKDEWEKLVEELKDIDKREVEQEDKKLEIPEE